MMNNKILLKTLILLFIQLFFMKQQLLFAQVKSECKVIMKSITGYYEGDCKKGKADGFGKAIGIDSYKGEFSKGLPDGKGIYTWSNGDVFEGNFKKGLKEGDGKLTYKSDQIADSMLIGFWKNDKYYGHYEYPYKVLAKTSPVNRIIIRKLGNSPNDVLIRGEMDLLRERGLNSIYFNGEGFDNVQFPFTFDMEANHANVPFSFKVIIFEPGRWEVIINFD